MSGHSHWATIKRQKAVTDAKKGKIFSKLARVITIAAKEKGGDVLTNASLRMAIEKAKEFNMPKDNIERAIKKGTGELEGEKLEEVIFEAFGPEGIALIIEGITDNKNRTLGEIKQILLSNNGKLANEGSVRWLFDKKGAIAISEYSDKEALELTAIESGAEDFKWSDNVLEIYAKPESLEQAKKNLESKGVKIESSQISFVAKEEISLEQGAKEKAEKLFEELDENDAVQNIYSNLKQ